MAPTHLSQVEKVADQILGAINGSMTKGQIFSEQSITVSIGGALVAEDEQDQKMLFKRADQALYTSKQKGKNQYHIDPLLSPQLRRTGEGS
jgi:diguanylate cyclase (GGDEF)-like protein